MSTKALRKYLRDQLPVDSAVALENMKAEQAQEALVLALGVLHKIINDRKVTQ